MGWKRTCRMSVIGIAVMLCVLFSFARIPIGADDSKPEKKPASGPVAPPPASRAVTPAEIPPPPAENPATKALQIKAAPAPGTISVDARNQLFLTTPARARFNFKIDPKTPAKDLLPVPPTSRRPVAPVLDDDLARVPEISFQESFARNLPPQKALEHIAHTVAKINHVNQKKHDAFMEVLLASRIDLSGMPFVMGEACRMKQERSKHFQQALNTIRQARGPQGMTPPLSGPVTVSGPMLPPPPIALSQPSAPLRPTKVAEPAPTPIAGATAPVPIPAAPPVTAVAAFVPVSESGNRVGAKQFWERYRAGCLREDNINAKYEPPYQEHVTLARIAALMQVLAPESASMRLGLVSYLATLSHPEATRALAKLAIFSRERSVREAACDALKVRRERDYTEVLLNGLHYPWPAVAKHAAEAIVKLERKDLIPQLIAVLDEPDPRLPVLKKEGDKSVPAVRELVRVNHHRNCLMCHAPLNNAGDQATRTVVQQGFKQRVANDGKVVTEMVVFNTPSADVPTAQVPVPGEPLPTPSQGYDNSNPDIMVRLDVTYLRQDFSAMQPVADAHPWPEMQRFDFLVRTRALTEQEAQVYRDKLSLREPGWVTPYQRAALTALRDLTGRDTAPTAEAWRRLLNVTEAK